MMQARPPRLAYKVAIITGASRGLGQLCAMAYAFEGAKVAVVGRNAAESPMRLPGNVHQTVAAIEEFTGGSALPIVCDVTDVAAVERMVEQVLDHWGRIDVLLNNAAYVMPEGESVTDIPVRLFSQMLQVNVLGAFQVIRAVLPAMQAKHRGNIINVSGRSRTRGSPLEATKAAMETLTIGLANELRPSGVAVNSLRPVGFIDTPGVLLNSEVKPRDLTPPDSYLDAAVLLAMQTAETYTGQVKTDAEVIRDLTDETTLMRYGAINPAAWGHGVFALSIPQSFDAEG
jgi:citronellol/citronellal dehydrogenase